MLRRLLCRVLGHNWHCWSIQRNALGGYRILIECQRCGKLEGHDHT